ncbi:hypothetical protein P691DRAFT_671702 [Macrolepiota fuliginosa MF-IS2]|uniref:G domain-containing protein n=1 Tax=Macrolepiota fuliginosa MF-IS2 TaxID=1400762 RepID=A0A9P6C344_9AGAR|nr:hypothetical protein P691DRAFT_671702 [Macrolepiota fuliginosa MF-IS2]
MGLTGTGKTSFISTFGKQDKEMKCSPDSCTGNISAVRVCLPGEDSGLVLVDTPGFDDTRKTNLQILKLISEWLERTGEKGVLLSGVLYLHRISDNRMAGTALEVLGLFKKLCGHDMYRHIVMVTTMWDRLRDENVGNLREEELRATFWAPVIRHGAVMMRYQNTKESAWDILEHILGGLTERRMLQLQRELIEMGKTFPSTAVGKELSKTINEIVKKQELLVQTLHNQLSKLDMDTDTRALLQEQRGELERQRENLDILRVPLKTKLRGALTSVPPHALIRSERV